MQSWLVLAALTIAMPVSAVTDLYSAEVAVTNQSDSVRETALQEALGIVVVRVSGDVDSAISTAGRQVTSRASRMVQQFGYKRVVLPREGEADKVAQNPDASESETPEEPATELRLQVRFNHGAVNSALRDAGLPVWGSERPNTMLWVARADGKPELISGEQAEPLEMAAAARGVPIELPRQSAEESRRAGAEDVIAGYTDRLRAVARGYGASHLLIGKVFNDSGLWRGQWTLAQSDGNLDEWQSSATSEEALLVDVMQRTANTYARQFAVSASASGNTAIVAIDRLDSVRDYARVSKYLSQLTAVRAVVPALVNREYAVFRVELSGDADVLRRSIALSDWLSEDESARDIASPFALGGIAMGYQIIH